ARWPVFCAPAEFTERLQHAFASWGTRSVWNVSPLRKRDMFVKELSQAGHTRKFSINKTQAQGWEIRDERDDRVVKQVCYTDWHRVERALERFQEQIEDLESRGWRD
ncbi:MAG TPA: hypothetical protein VGL62_07770, partial [Vicinamibacterales bacterium]